MSIVEPRIDKLLDKTEEDKYLLCALSSKRSRDINDMMRGQRDRAVALQSVSEIAEFAGRKPLSLAMEEIARGEVSYGKAQGMTSDNRGDILQQLPGESIDHIEVITNPSSKYSAEGSAGIINIVLKRNRKAGYYGGAQASVNSKGGGRAGANINFSSPKFDAYLNIGYGRRVHENGGWTERDYMDGDTPTGYLNQNSDGEHKGNNIFFRGGFTWHMTEKDEISFGYMGSHGKGDTETTHHYTSGPYLSFSEPRAFWRKRVNEGDNEMKLNNFELSYRHDWSQGQFLEAMVSTSNWKMDGDTYYDQNTYYLELRLSADAKNCSVYADRLRPGQGCGKQDCRRRPGGAHHGKNRHGRPEIR